MSKFSHDADRASETAEPICYASVIYVLLTIITSHKLCSTRLRNLIKIAFVVLEKSQEEEGKPSETDSIKFKISSKTPRGKKDSTKRHHHRHHKRQPCEQ